MFSSTFTREVKLNFKQMEKSRDCQEDFSMHYSSLAQNLYVFIQMLCVELWDLMVTGSAFEVQNSNKIKMDD